MNRSCITICRYPYDDSAWHIEFFADNGGVAATQDFYIYPEDLAEFGNRLADFPKNICDEARFELGSPSGNWAYHVLLRAYIYDNVGHAALEVFLDKRGRAPVAAKANFHIMCDVAELNRFGNSLKEWTSDPAQPLRWEAH